MKESKMTIDSLMEAITTSLISDENKLDIIKKAYGISEPALERI